ncbi:dihydrodipicolinate reductase [Actinobacillus pleuropneumoniae]|nr:dihydrodipicolinate reductase [Actinobacillus pleuropneumoniae]
MTLKIGIVGAGGRMGRNLITAVQNAEGVELGAAFERKGSSLVGADAGEVAGIGATGVKISDDLNQNTNFDVLIDFTRPEGTLEHINFV